jgi:hypothetical protein
MDECYYCKVQYHPMKVYIRTREAINRDPGKPERISVCSETMNTYLDRGAYPGCEQKAIADGYIFRPELTRRR